MLLQKAKKYKGGRLLISVSVIGSAGPLRFLVNEDELVDAVINTALKSYAREGRLPVLGSDLNDFLLYSTNAGSDALSPLEQIGSIGKRNFLLCKKSPAVLMVETPGRTLIRKKGSGGLMAWLNKSLTFKITSH